MKMVDEDLKETMNEREARFLASQAERLGGIASQAERLGGNKKKSQISLSNDGDHPPELVNDDNASGAGSIKEQSHQFFTNFRRICSDFQSQIDQLLLVPSPSSPTINGEETTSSKKDISNYDEVKAHYATATRRNEGRIKLDAILRDVRSLQRHALSSSSSTAFASREENNDVNVSNDLLQPILQNPMPDITQTDVRLISQEMDKILKRIDDAREIVCPKEKFVFKRYRKAMEELERNGGVADFSTTGAKQHNALDEEKGGTEKKEQDNLQSKYGGVLENMSNCTVEISSDGTILVDKTTEDQLRYYSSARPFHAVHPTAHTGEGPQKNLQPSTQQESSSSSYLLQNLQNVTLVIHGSRPSLHLQHIRNCKIYMSEPTLGAVHVTDCHLSEIRCSCYQLRVHDSRDVNFCVWVRSGPIIEDSKGMVFEGNYYLDAEEETVDGSNNIITGVGRNMFWDVKDFNWLRALRKSPNFLVIAKSTEKQGEELVNKDSLVKDAVTKSIAMDNSGKEPALSSDEEDSEDEL